MRHCKAWLSSLLVRVAFCLSASLCGLPAVAGDAWVAPTDPSVITNNDCGFVSAVSGEALIRRSYMGGSGEGGRAYVADRIHSGDELIVPPGGRLEWTSGDNMLIVLGSDSQVRLGGLRSFADINGVTVLRLDVAVLRGECRVQVRQNMARPEAALFSLEGVEVLVRRGDADIAAGDGSWQVAVVDGEAQARLRRGAVVGAPFAIAAGSLVGSSGEERLGGDEATAIRVRMPFSFELVSAALSPLPAMSRMLEAP